MDDADDLTDPSLESTQQAALRYLTETQGVQQQLGDYFEFGVGELTFFVKMHALLRALRLPDVRMFAFAASSSRGGPVVGPPLSALKKQLRKRGVDLGRCVLTPGPIDDVEIARLRSRHWVRKASMIAVDGGQADTLDTVLPFCEPLIAREAVVFVLHHAPAPADLARAHEERIWEQFMRKHPHFRVLPLGPDGPRASSVVLRRVAL